MAIAKCDLPCRGTRPQSHVMVAVVAHQQIYHVPPPPECQLRDSGRQRRGRGERRNRGIGAERNGSEGWKAEILAAVTPPISFSRL